MTQDSFENIQNTYDIFGHRGLPESYPVPKVKDMLFYIQRNQNINTVIYKLNKKSNSHIVKNNPIYIYWKKFNNNNPDTEINIIQQKLAYGAQFETISDDSLILNIVSYPEYKIYVSKDNNNIYQAVSLIDNVWATLSNVYVFAEETGAFPIVKYVELYGIRKDDGLPCYEKIIISE